MAETRWTDEQLSAIETRDKTLLVSAAAGSGKTATLTERIIRSLLDEDSPMNIDSMLIVTFTNAAAGELRAKISRALASAVEKNPENKHLKRQLNLLPGAKIRTIDSFCNEILRANCDRVGLSPNYRIADTAESELLAISIIEGLIESVYNGELSEIASPSEFEELCDCLTDSKRTEELAGIFRYIHLKCESAEPGIELLRELIDCYSATDIPIEKNRYGEFLVTRLRDALSHYRAAYEKYERIFSSGSPAENKYLATLDSDLSTIRALLSLHDYNSLRDALSQFSLCRLASVKSADKTRDMESFAILRKMMKADILKLSGLFSYTDAMWRSLFSDLHRLLSVLYRFEVRFDAIFSEEKRRIGALSYADIERYTYKCLINNGERSDIALNVASQFDAVYIDEYQDVNSLQNRIFEAISRPNNRFMVGDIKQSIYGFRSARPQIFAEMKAAFPHISEASGDTASIFMSRNFRCDRAIVDFVNSVFDRAFSFVSDSIGYSEGDRLGYAKTAETGESEYIAPSVYMLDKHSEGDEDMSARFTAATIDGLLREGRLNNGEAIRPSDIAIIMRNAKGKAYEYSSALAELGIPACISGAKDFFLSSEVLLALCLLNTIDNPRRDVYLAGLLCSPLFDFSADDLYLISLEKQETLYESLVKYTECNVEFTKGRYFLEKLNYYRQISEGVGVDTLIYKLYRETGLMSLASCNGGRENLILLYDFARSYEAGSFKGLYNFISFINSVIDKKTTFDDARAQSGVDAVKIVTCHASKGLEYPVVFLVDASAKLVNKERNSRLVFSEDFGIAFRLRTPSGLATVDNPVRDIINLSIDQKLYEEELRILYVALTRARERLYIVGECPKIKRGEYESELLAISDNLSKYSFCELNSYMEIISLCRAVLPSDGAPSFDALADSDPEEADSASPSDILSDAATENSDRQTHSSTNEAIGDYDGLDTRLIEDLKQRFDYKYHSPHLTLLPEKLSVSLLSPTVLDGSDKDAVYLIADEEERRRLLPEFVSGTSAEESAKRGIATHLFMQFCDLDNLKNNGERAELDRLEKRGFLSREDARRVRLSEIKAFAESPLFSEMRGAKRLFRELRFNVRLPASAFSGDEKRREDYIGRLILVQGVIDCVIEHSDGSLSLYDYKTDRLSREEREDRLLAEEKLRKKHSMQLGIYSMAIKEIFGRSPEQVGIYSLPLGSIVML